MSISVLNTTQADASCRAKMWGHSKFAKFVNIRSRWSMNRSLPIYRLDSTLYVENWSDWSTSIEVSFISDVPDLVTRLLVKSWKRNFLDDTKSARVCKVSARLVVLQYFQIKVISTGKHCGQTKTEFKIGTNRITYSKQRWNKVKTVCPLQFIVTWKSLWSWKW